MTNPSERKDRMMRMIRIGVTVGAIAVLLAACSGGSSSTSSSATTATTTTSTTSSTSAPAGGTELTLTAPVGAANTGFAEKTLSVAADTDFTIEFDNQDAGIPHNVQIFEGTATTGTPVWAPPGDALVTGVDQATYEIPGLAAGTYTYDCLSHPATMVGTLTVS
jgi:plastocyanin